MTNPTFILRAISGKVSPNDLTVVVVAGSLLKYQLTDIRVSLQILNSVRIYIIKCEKWNVN